MGTDWMQMEMDKRCHNFVTRFEKTGHNQRVVFYLRMTFDLQSLMPEWDIAIQWDKALLHNELLSADLKTFQACFRTCWLGLYKLLGQKHLYAATQRDINCKTI